MKKNLECSKCFRSEEEKAERDMVTVFVDLKERNGNQIVDFVLCCCQTECLKLPLSSYEMGCL